MEYDDGGCEPQYRCEDCQAEGRIIMDLIGKVATVLFIINAIVGLVDSFVENPKLKRIKDYVLSISGWALVMVITLVIFVMIF